jgi:hypothetical protein
VGKIVLLNFWSASAWAEAQTKTAPGCNNGEGAAADGYQWKRNREMLEQPAERGLEHVLVDAGPV